MLAKDGDDDVPSFFIVDVDDECGDGIVRQGHKRRVDGFFLWLWFLSFRTWAGHICQEGKDGGWCETEVCVILISNRVPPLSATS
jgi:hypothetical protein